MIYLDNAATTWPKPDVVWEAMENIIKNLGANPGRAGHQMALDAGRVVMETRELIAHFFNVKSPDSVIYTLNATEALNLALKGCLSSGDHVVTTSMEHNAVSRPLYALNHHGVKVSKVQCENTGEIDPEGIRRAINSETKAIVITHASNVTGTLMPIDEIGKIAKENGVLFIVDASQTAGVFPIDMQKLGINLLAMPGHKSLLGPQGTGLLCMGEDIDLLPLKEGGTGSKSETPYQPDVVPDRYESGTINTPGIAGLGAAVKFIMEEGMGKIREHELYLCSSLIDGLRDIRGVKIYGPGDAQKQAPVVSFNFENHDSAEVGFILDKAFNIASRTGLHCAPDAHKTIGTFEQGTVRLSISYHNTLDEINEALNALGKISAELGYR